ncbi:MAG: ubiquinol-cytochrome c reductase iron-sulfur subunit [Gammaproteobacteria bacterium]
MDNIDHSKRRFLVVATTFLGSIGAILTSIPFIASWFPSARTKASATPIKVDLSQLQPGELMTVTWRKNPVWILHRTQEMIASLTNHNNLLRDPTSKVDQQPLYAKNIYRSIKPEYLVLIAYCTHLSCIPNYEPNNNKQWPGGFLCPCHGSKYDLSGRVFKNVPAPINLAVPPYRYISDKVILIGEESLHA